MTTRAFCLLIAAIILGGCASSRPPSLVCGLKDFSEDRWGSGGIFGLDEQAVKKPRSVNVLALSAGGENGAYGAGLMRGWQEQGGAGAPISADQINVVTGVSTGAILATHVFLEKYDEIDDLYRNISGKDIYKQRPIFGMLFGGNSVLTTEGKRALIESYLTTQIIDDVAQRAISVRGIKTLFIGMVNMDSGAFVRINLVKLAAADFANRGGKAQRDKCFRAVVDASSAIPIAFEPVFIDGSMYSDGGARYYAFLQNLSDADKGPTVTRRLFTVVHSQLQVNPICTKNALLPIATRVFDIFTDDAAKDAMLRLEYAATRLGDESKFITHYADASTAALSPACQSMRKACESNGSPTSEDMFCKPFMQCLSSAGRADGTLLNVASNWRDVWKPIEEVTIGAGKNTAEPACKD